MHEPHLKNDPSSEWGCAGEQQRWQRFAELAWECKALESLATLSKSLAAFSDEQTGA